MPEVVCASVDAYLDAVLIGGRERRRVVVAAYDPAWPERFSCVAHRVVGALGADALSVEHVGSTSVPGLAAKPIVDVLLTVLAVEDEAAYVPRLEAAGLVLRVREPGHRMLRTPERDVHLHVHEPDHPEVAAMRDLRDWLRVSAQDRELYAATKRSLAERDWPDMNHYAVAKSDVVQAVLGRARQWRATGSPLH